MNGAIPALGLDLGTTFSVVAQVSRGGVPTSLPNAEGSPTTPSVVCSMAIRSSSARSPVRRWRATRSTWSNW